MFLPQKQPPAAGGIVVDESGDELKDAKTFREAESGDNSIRSSVYT